jgi:thymidylate synthase
MSYADKVFVENANEILNHGTDTSSQEVRPHWADGTKAYTIKKFGICNRYDLRKEFPAITLRKTAIKSAMDEILWIFQKKSNNIHDLNSHIWDEWADENGSIGKAYGYQIGEKFIHHKVTIDINIDQRNSIDFIDSKTKEVLESYKEYPSVELEVFADIENININIYMDQMDAVLYDLKHTPFSRRIMTSLWNFSELHEMNLQPCCWSCEFNVTDEGGDKLVLNMILNHRSNDFLTANNWNTVQYALLLMMIAQSCNMVAGELVVMCNDMHIYDRHVDLVKELITREQHPAPSVRLNPEVTDFYKFTTDDLIVEDYVTGPQIKNIPVAI